MPKSSKNADLAFDFIAEWMQARGLHVPFGASFVDQLLESLVEQTADEARQSGYDQGYDVASGLSDF